MSETKPTRKKKTYFPQKYFTRILQVAFEGECDGGLAAVFRHMTIRGANYGSFRTTNKAIAQQTFLSERTVQRKLKLLVEVGLVNRNYRGWQGIPSIYQINERKINTILKYIKEKNLEF